MTNVFEEAISLREGGTTVFDKVEGSQFSKGRKQFFNLRREEIEQQINKNIQEKQMFYHLIL